MSDAVQPPIAFALLLPMALGGVARRGAWRLPGRGPALLVVRRGDPLLDLLALQAYAGRPLNAVVEGGRWPRAVLSALKDRLRVVPYEVPGDLVSRARRTGALAWVEHRLIEGEAVALVAGEGRIHSLEVAPLEGLADELLSRRPALPGPLPVLPVRIDLSGGRMTRRAALVTAGAALPEVAPGRAVEGIRAALKQALDELAAPRMPPEDVDVVAALLPLARERLGDVGQEPEPALPADFHLRIHRARLARPLAVRRLVEAGRNYLDALALAGPPPGEQVRTHLLAEALLVLGGLPAALYGWLFHALPCLLARVLAGSAGWSVAWQRLRWAAVLVPAFYALQGWGLAFASGPWRALVFVMAAPPAGLWALAWGPLAEGLRRDLRTALRLGLLSRTADRLEAYRLEAVSALDDALELYR